MRPWIANATTKPRKLTHGAMRTGEAVCHSATLNRLIGILGIDEHAQRILAEVRRLRQLGEPGTEIA